MNEENQNVDETEVEEELVDNDLQDESRTDGEESGEESEEQDSDDVSGTDDEDDPDEGNSRGARKARRDAQIDRLKEENRKLKEQAKEKGSEKGVETNSELTERAYLSANDLKDKDAQDEVIRLADKLGMTVIDAIDDGDIMMRANSIIKKKQAARSVAKGTGGSSQKTKGVSYHTAYFDKNGTFAEGATNEMIAKVTDELAKR